MSGFSYCSLTSVFLFLVLTFVRIYGKPKSTAHGLQVGDLDHNWLYSFDNSPFASTVVGGAGDSWKQFSLDANWVSPILAENSGAATGNYTFATKFDIGEIEIVDFYLEARISSDNAVMQISINDESVPLVVPCNSDKTYTCVTDYKFPQQYFAVGENSISFVVNNLEYTPAIYSRVGIYVEFAK